MFISQQPKAKESTNWYQKIAKKVQVGKDQEKAQSEKDSKTIYYNHILRYINKLNSLLLQYLGKLAI